jgi:predicted Zn-dependent protease
VVFGDNPNQGLTRGSSFLHPALRFRLDFPDRWEVANSPRQVVAKAPNDDVFIVLQVLTQPIGRDVREVALNSMQGAGFRPIDGERTSINGLDAFVGTYLGQIDGLGPVASRAGRILHRGSYYLMAGLVSVDRLRQVDGQFLGAIRSFRALSAPEAEAIRPARLTLHTVRAGDTWASLASRSAGAITPASLAIMNHAAGDSQPQPDTRILIVAGG